MLAASNLLTVLVLFPLFATHMDWPSNAMPYMSIDLFFFLGAIPVTKLLWILGMLVLGALSVGLRYLANAGPSAE